MVPDWATLLQSAREYTFQNFLETIFLSPYYPVFYGFNCIYICLHLRRQCGCGGLQWWRSFGLGYLLSYGHRVFFGWLISRTLPESQSLVFLTYSVIWACLNIAPFDIFHRFLNRPILQFTISVFSHFGENQLVIDFLRYSSYIFPNKPLSWLWIVAAVYSIRLFIDWFDNVVFDLKRRQTLYSFADVSRWTLSAALILGIVTLVYTTPHFHGIFISAASGAFQIALKLLDWISYGNEFDIVDFPGDFFRTVFTFHALRE